MSSNANTLTAARELILPAVHSLQGLSERQGIPIVSADIWIDFVQWELDLCVKYRLLNGGELINADWKSEIAPRLRSAMQLFNRMPAAKAISLERRRLLARGERATKSKRMPK